MLIIREAKPAHWYYPNGLPCHEVPKKDGSGMRATNVADAFKLGLFRSVTNVLGVIAKEGLVRWRIEQGIVSALTLPHLPGESEQDFAHRVADDSEAQAKDAADEGKRLHGLAEAFLREGTMPTSGEDARLMAPFFAWCQSRVKRTICAEETVVNPAWYYAGKLDAALMLEDGGDALLDIKTQDVKLDTKGNPKPEFREDWPTQLSAYAACDIGFFKAGHPWRLLSGVVARNFPGFWVKEWQNPHRHFIGFCAHCDSWSYLKGGTPGKDKEKCEN